MKLIVEPDNGVAPLLAAIRKAKRSVEIAVFRFDRADIASALKEAVARGVRVTSLVASTNRGGVEDLRQLESHFLETGITVTRSADDLVRYHDKILIIDQRILCLLSFNCTEADIDRSRGFGIITKHRKWVQEAIRLFEADSGRNPFDTASSSFVVSPCNSRKVLAGFLRRARKQLLIYDPKISDKQMIGILEGRMRAGVEVRILGGVDRRAHLPFQRLPSMRLHTRTIIRDGHRAFVGSQSLRSVELDARREVGLIIRDAKTLKSLIEVFEFDWAKTNSATSTSLQVDTSPADAERGAEVATQVLAREMDPLTASVREAVKKVVAEAGEAALGDPLVQETVKKVVKKAVKQAVEDVVQEVADDRNKI